MSLCVKPDDFASSVYKSLFVFEWQHLAERSLEIFPSFCAGIPVLNRCTVWYNGTVPFAKGYSMVYHMVHLFLDVTQRILINHDRMSK